MTAISTYKLENTQNKNCIRTVVLVTLPYMSCSNSAVFPTLFSPQTTTRAVLPILCCSNGFLGRSPTTIFFS